jgi:alpha-1,2-mannosyltransferase
MYAASLATRHLVNATESWDLLDMNPPHFHLALIPFLPFELRTAAILWLLLNLAAAGTAGVLLVQTLRLRPRVGQILPIVVAVLLCDATYATVVTGQFTGLLLLGTVLAWRAARGDQWLTAGAWLGLLIGVKPFLVLFVPYLLVTKRWSALASAAAVGAASFAIGLAYFGWAAHREWLAALGAVDWAWASMNGSAWALFTRALTRTPQFAPIVLAPTLARVLSLIAAIVITWVTVYLARRRSVDQAFALILTGALLVSPLGWIYYLWMAIGPCLALWHEHRPRVLWFAVPFLALPYFVALIGQPSPWLTLTIGSACTWGMFLLWLAVVRTPPGRAMRTHADIA